MTKQMPAVGFYRDTNDIESHLATSWTSEALCGARPFMRTIGWTLGTDSGLYVAAVCSECQEANREIAASLA